MQNNGSKSKHTTRKETAHRKAQACGVQAGAAVLRPLVDPYSQEAGVGEGTQGTVLLWPV